MVIRGMINGCLLVTGGSEAKCPAAGSFFSP
jgi:hypothetical protein